MYLKRITSDLLPGWTLHKSHSTTNKQKHLQTMSFYKTKDWQERIQDSDIGRQTGVSSGENQLHKQKYTDGCTCRDSHCARKNCEYQTPQQAFGYVAGPHGRVQYTFERILIPCLLLPPQPLEEHQGKVKNCFYIIKVLYQRKQEGEKKPQRGKHTCDRPSCDPPRLKHLVSGCFKLANLLQQTYEGKQL